MEDSVPWGISFYGAMSEDGHDDGMKMIKLSILLMMMNGWNEDDIAFEIDDDE